MDKSKIKKTILIFLTISFIVAGVAIGAKIRKEFVFIDGVIYNSNIDSLHVFLNQVNINELNRCSQLSTLVVAEADNDSLTKLYSFPTLEFLDIFRSKTQISGSGINKINTLENLKYLFFTYSDVDLYNLNSDSIESIGIDHCNVSFLEGINKCAALNELKLNAVILNDNMISTNGNDLYNRICVLNNSSDFSSLDNIKKLHIYNTVIENISGIVEMDSLEVLYVSKGTLSDDNRNTLENKGIRIIEEESAE